MYQQRDLNSEPARNGTYSFVGSIELSLTMPIKARKLVLFTEKETRAALKLSSGQKRGGFNNMYLSSCIQFYKLKNCIIFSCKIIPVVD